MGQIWFQNQSIETEVVRSDRFCCPIAFPLVNAMTHLVANHYFSLQPVFTTKWFRKVIL